MPAKAALIVIGLVGLVLLALLLTRGISTDRALSNGSPWRRKLVAYGVALLAVLGQGQSGLPQAALAAAGATGR